MAAAEEHFIPTSATHQFRLIQTIIMRSSSGVLVRFQLMGIHRPGFHALESIYECDDPACCGCGCPVFCNRYAYLPDEVSEALLFHVELHHAS
jgi:hypothetical protein